MLHPINNLEQSFSIFICKTSVSLRYLKLDFETFPSSTYTTTFIHSKPFPKDPKTIIVQSGLFRFLFAQPFAFFLSMPNTHFLSSRPTKQGVCLQGSSKYRKRHSELIASSSLLSLCTLVQVNKIPVNGVLSSCKAGHKYGSATQNR